MSADSQAFFSASPGGPGGGSIFNYSPPGVGSVQAAGQVNPQAQPAAAHMSSFSIPPVVWAFLFLIGGYVGLHKCLKAV